MLNARKMVGSHDVVLVTLDTLRYDVAQRAFENGETPGFASLLPTSGWEKRHSPANFTYAAHHAFFAGFLPTPSQPGLHPRLFASRFSGSSTTMEETCTFDGPDIVSGFADAGYKTICIGGVGFFNKQNPLGSVLPRLFSESHWCPAFSVTDRNSTTNQVDCAIDRVRTLPTEKRVFLFLNVSALHQPNCLYIKGATADTVETHAAALRYVDTQIPRLFRALQRRAPILGLICSDHGTAYGEEGYVGHRVGHASVWNVPYAELVLERDQES